MLLFRKKRTETDRRVKGDKKSLKSNVKPENSKSQKKMYEYEKKVFASFRKKISKKEKVEEGSEYLRFCEEYIRVNYQYATIYVYEEYIRSLQYACNCYPDNLLMIFYKGEEMLKYLVQNNRMGNNRLMYEFIVLMRKTNILNPPEYVFDIMKDLKIGKPSFKVSASLLTSYTTAAIKFLSTNYLEYAEQSFYRMNSNFSFVQIYLWNAMLNMYYKFGFSDKVWETFDLMERKKVEKNAFTYGSLMETCLHLDSNPKKGLLIHQQFRNAGFQNTEKHVKYVNQLAKKLRSLQEKQESSSSADSSSSSSNASFTTIPWSKAYHDYSLDIFEKQRNTNGISYLQRVHSDILMEQKQKRQKSLFADLWGEKERQTNVVNDDEEEL